MKITHRVGHWRARIGMALLACGLFVTAALFGCIATETGNPSGRPVVDPGLLTGEVLPDDPMLPSPPTIAVRGPAGAVDPPEGVVFAWAIEIGGPPASQPVAADGSFGFTLSALPGELVRVEVRAADGTRSLPLDFRVSATEGLLVATPRPPCVAVEPTTGQLELSSAPGSEQIISIVNRCSESVSRATAVLRSGEAAFELVDDGPLELPAGATSTIRVRTTDSADPTTEDIVRIEFASPEPDVRAVSLRISP